MQKALKSLVTQYFKGTKYSGKTKTLYVPEILNSENPMVGVENTLQMNKISFGKSFQAIKARAAIKLAIKRGLKIVWI